MRRYRCGSGPEETVGIIRGEGGEARAFQADVTKSANVAAMTEEWLKTYGRIDVLDNNVGVTTVGGVVEVSEAEWDRVMAINLKEHDAGCPLPIAWPTLYSLIYEKSLAGVYT